MGQNVFLHGGYCDAQMECISATFVHPNVTSVAKGLMQISEFLKKI